MSDQPQNGQELELQAGDKKLRIQGSDIFNMFNMVAIGVLLVGGWQHVEAGKEAGASFVQAVKEQTKAQWQMVNAQREANCLARLTPEQKKRFEEINFCKHLGEGR